MIELRSFFVLDNFEVNKIGICGNFWSTNWGAKYNLAVLKWQQQKSDSGSIGGPWVVELLILLAWGGAFFSCLIVTHSKG